MRISDWSSDVCSSDLVVQGAQPADQRHALQLRLGDEGGAGAAREHEDVEPTRMVGEEDHVAPHRPADIVPAHAANEKGRAWSRESVWMDGWSTVGGDTLKKKNKECHDQKKTTKINGIYI